MRIATAPHPRLTARVRINSLLALLGCAASLFPSLGQADDAQAFSSWRTGKLPFSFTYGGKNAGDVKWTRTEEILPADHGVIHRFVFRDAETSLKIVADVRTFDDFPAVDWVIHLTNESEKDTPLIEDFRALDWQMPLQAAATLQLRPGQ